MILKSIYLNLDRTEFGNDVGYKFQCQSRCLCSYLGRHIKPLKFKCDFGRIVITGKHIVNQPCYVNSSNVACIELDFDINKFQLITSPKELHDFFADMLIQGFKVLNNEYSIPLEELIAGINSFKEADYKNKWVHKKRYFREQGIRVRLDCELTIDKFTLQLVIMKNKTTVYDKVILETDADEVAFDYRFKDIQIDKDYLIVTSKVSEHLIQIPLAAI